MNTIRIVWGTGRGPTETASYDAALASANIHNYNLVSVSSVIPAHGRIEVVGDAPPLGPTGNRVTVVEGRSTLAPEESGQAVASLGWSREPDGPGIFYEAAGADPETVPDEIESGLAAGETLRPWDFEDRGRRMATAPEDSERYTTAVVLAVYGESEPIL